MSATPKQIEANRRNAQLSTGPKTEEGKAATSRNALKHGLLAQKHVLLDESPDDFSDFLAGFLADLAPATPMETHLAKIVATTAFRLQRVPRIETEMFNARMTKLADASNKDNLLGAAFTFNASDAIKTLTRYESSLNRQFNAALKQLTALKLTRLATPASCPSVETQCLASPQYLASPVLPPSNAPVRNKPDLPLDVDDKSLSDSELLDRCLHNIRLAEKHGIPLPPISEATYQAACAALADLTNTNESASLK